MAHNGLFQTGSIKTQVQEWIMWIGISLITLSAATGMTKFVTIGATALTLLYVANGKFRSKRGYKYVLLLSTVSVVAFIWCFIPIGLPRSFAFLEKYLSTIFISLLFIKAGFSEKQLMNTLKIFCYAVLAVYVFLLVNASFSFVFKKHDYSQTEFFFYTDLAAAVGNAHPSYLALAGCVGCLVCFMVFEADWKRALYITFISIVIVLLNARLILVVHALTVFIAIIVYFGMNRGLLITSIVGIGLTIAVGYILVSGVHLKPNRSLSIDVKESFERSASQVTSSDNGLTVRLFIWRTAIEAILQRPFFGAGTGRENEVLMDRYNAKGSVYVLSEQLNSHNQYFSFLITFGLVGSLLILGSFFILFYYSLSSSKKFSLIYLLIIVVFLLAMTTESILNRFHGLTLFSYVNCLMFAKFKDDTRFFRTRFIVR